jgi:two-component system chemotaxis response regulator CheY
MRALVIDDSRAIRMIMGKLLKELGFDVVEAADGGQALAKLEEHGAFDLALVDWNMPEVDGYEFVCRARGDGRYGTMKIMMVTTESELAQVEKALAAGADEYLMKPFNKDAVVAKLNILGLC